MYWFLLGAAFVVLAATLIWRRRWMIQRGRLAFHGQPLQEMLAAGATDHKTTRLWGRTGRPGEHRLTMRRAGEDEVLGRVALTMHEARGADGTFSVCYPTDFPDARELAPLTRYICSLEHADGTRLAECSFETAPLGVADAPRSFSIAVMSCHLPFDDYGHASEDANRLLLALPSALDEYGVKRVLLMGDQMYGDLPEHCSLLNSDYFKTIAPPGRGTLLECTREEVRRLYQMRHRLFWKGAAFRSVQANCACHLILDDHEIIDNFGSNLDHASRAYHALKQGALDAFYDYQASRVLPLTKDERPAAFYHSFVYGPLGVFVMDLRSERHATEDEIRVYSDAQLESLERFLSQSADKHVVCLVLSVPILHVPDWLAQAGITFSSPDGDLEDRWSNPKSVKSRDRLLQVVFEHQRRHPKQRFVILGGDVHVGVLGRLKWGQGVRDTYQLVSSAISNTSEWSTRRFFEAMPDLKPVMGHDGFHFQGELLPARDASSGAPAPSSNPYGQLNCGIVQVERISAEESTVRLLLVGHTKGTPPTSKVVFDSGPL